MSSALSGFSISPFRTSTLPSTSLASPVTFNIPTNLLQPSSSMATPATTIQNVSMQNTMAMMMSMYQMMSMMMAQRQMNTTTAPAVAGTPAAITPTVGQAAAATPANIKLTDAKSLDKGIDQIAGSTVSGSLANYLQTLKAGSKEATQVQTQLANQMRLEGRSQKEMQSLGLLLSMQQLDSTKADLTKASKGATKTDMTTIKKRQADVTKRRADMVTQFQTLNGISVPAKTPVAKK